MFLVDGADQKIQRQNFIVCCVSRLACWLELLVFHMLELLAGALDRSS